MIKLPITAQLARMVVAGKEYGCEWYTATLASMLSGFILFYFD